MATTYTVRVVTEEGNIIAYIDADGSAVIGQPNFPGQPGNWATEEEAKAWADKHAQELNDASAAADAAQLAAEQRQAEQDALIAQAKIDSQKIAELHDMLTKLTSTTPSA